MTPASSSPTRERALVAALQWGLVSSFVLDTTGRLVRNYYRATSDAFFLPDWIFLVQVASLPALLVGAGVGYWWLASGRGDATESAHGVRVRFVGALLVGWALAIVPTTALQAVLGDASSAVPYFLLPTLFASAALVGAYLLAYRVDRTWYDRRRSRLLGAGQGALVGLLLGLVGFVTYGSYLAATRTNYGLDGGPGLAVLAGLGAVVGYRLVDSREAADRAAEFVTLLVLATFALSVATGLSLVAVDAVGLAFPGSLLVYPLAPLVASLALATYLTYRVRTNVYGRIVGRGE